MATQTVFLSNGPGTNATYVGNPPDDNFIITDNGGNDTITLGNGTDQLTLLNGNNTLTLGNGTDVIAAGSGNNTITTGTRGHQRIDAAIDLCLAGAVGPEIGASACIRPTSRCLAATWRPLSSRRAMATAARSSLNGHIQLASAGDDLATTALADVTLRSLATGSAWHV